MRHFLRILRPAWFLILAGLILSPWSWLLDSHFSLGLSSIKAASAANGAPDPTQCPSATSTPPATATMANTIRPSPSPTFTGTAAPSITPSPTFTQSCTSTPSASPSNTSTPSCTQVGSATPSTTPTVAPSDTITPTSTATVSVTPTPSPTAEGSHETPWPLHSVVINEIAWAGTLASSFDEWIELRNTTSHAISLSGWTLSDSGDINVNLSGSIPAHGYFLLERSDDGAIRDLPAQQIYTGSLHNSGERLRLRDPSGALVDSANDAGGAWPAGDGASRASMERRGYNDSWTTFSGSDGIGHDANGNPIQGTPGMPNSAWNPTPIPGSETPTPSPTPSATPAATGDPFPEGSLWIHEIAWAGTLASSADEWIELYNPGDQTISLQGWTLSDGGDIQISLQGSIPPKTYFLLERTDDASVADIPADQIYSGTLSNSGEVLDLRDPTGRLIDCANPKGRAWQAGESSSRKSMERIGGHGSDATWGTFNGHHGNGHDADGNAIQGTPRSQNSVQFPPPPPMWIKGKVVINEVLIRPHYDWEGKGGVDPGDEFIELLNLGPLPVFLKGWILDDVAQGGSSPYTIPGISLRPGSYVALFRNQTRLALNDGGDTVRLVTPDGQLVDQISYLKVRAYNLSYGRLPDGSGHLLYGLWPTPGEPNELFLEGGIPVTSLGPCVCAYPGEEVPLRSHFPLRPPWTNQIGLCVH